MSDQVCRGDVCSNHSGQDEKIKAASKQVSITNWMLGTLITVIIGVGGALYTQLQSVAIAMAQVTTRLTAFEERIQRMDMVDQRLNDRMDRVEGRR